MSSSITSSNGTATGVRIALAVAGIIAAIVGILVLAWRTKTAMVITVLVAIYAITAGLVYIGVGIWSKTRRGWSRAGRIILGVVFVIAGIVAFSYLGATTLALATFLGVVVGIMWIVEGVVALSTVADVQAKGWTIFFAIISVAAGVVMLFAPLAGIALLVWLLGILLIVVGVVQVVRALSYGDRRDSSDAMPLVPDELSQRRAPETT